MNNIVLAKGGLGRGIASLVREGSVSTAMGERYVRERDAARLLGDNLRSQMRLSGPFFHPDPIRADDEVLLCSAYICAYRRNLRKTDEGDFPLLRKLRAGIEGERTNRRKCLAHMELQEID